MHPEAFFLAVGDGQRFCLHYPPQVDSSHRNARGAILYIHPFAEEMNKARRMATLQARALAGAGYAVLQMDLLGCGDSSGDFADASWQRWVDDVERGCDWLRNRYPAALWLWGLRAGCLLAAQAAARLQQDCHLVFWQPPAAGKTLLHQFLRLKLAAGMREGQSGSVMHNLRQQLASGATVEVAGYPLPAALASGLEQAELTPPARAAALRRVEWFELSPRDDAAPGPASAQAISRWQHAGAHVQTHMVQGPAFWQSTELEEAPALLAATLAALGKPEHHCG